MKSTKEIKDGNKDEKYRISKTLLALLLLLLLLMSVTDPWRGGIKAWESQERTRETKERQKLES